MAKRKGSSASGPRTRSKAAEERREAEEVENSKRLDKLPQEVMDKILGHLDENDLFPLALSCRYFRQKQKELVARTRESGKPRLALKTNLKRKLKERHPASADYLRFCSKEKVSRNVGPQKAAWIRNLAGYHGNLTLLQELLAGVTWIDPGISEAAAEGGQLETLKWLKTQREFELHELIFTSACAGGHLKIVKWLRSEGCPWDGEACSNAAWGGHLEILKWLRSEGCPWDGSACAWAARNGHLETLKWLRSEGCPWNKWACIAAAMGGHLETLKWLRSQDPPCPWDAQTSMWAAYLGHLKVLKWLRSEGCPWDKWACSHAAEGGHFEALKWLRSQDPPCPWGEETCAHAAEWGQLEVLRWLKSEGCPWDERTCQYAAANGHLDVLKYARENDCPWDGRTWYWAAPSTREWLEDNDCPEDYDASDDYE